MLHRAGSAVPTTSRSGRELQKYGENGERLVAGSIPVRFKPGMDGPESVEVLLISSRKGKGHVFPKGGWECDEELRDAAARETVEEAGVRGELEEPILGKFPFYSGKAERLHTAHRGHCVAYVFAMHVTEELPVWPESQQRNREWCSLQEAFRRCRYDWMREALALWMQRRGWHAAVAACQQQLAQEKAAATQPPACAAIMATGQVPEVPVPATVERIAVRT